MTSSETPTAKPLDCPSWCVSLHTTDFAQRQEAEQGERVHRGHVWSLDDVTMTAIVEVSRVDDLEAGTAGPVGVSTYVEGVLTAEQAAEYASALRRGHGLASALRRGELPCPEWCVEHYTGEDGGLNHASFPQAVTGAGTYSSDPIIVSTWTERRDLPDGTTEAVGIIERKLSGQDDEDVQLTAGQLRELIDHLAAVTVAVEQAR